MALTYSVPVAQLGDDARAAFLTRTYAHLLGAILAFAAIEVFFFQSGIAEVIFSVVQGTSWLLILGAFMVVGWLASSTAARSTSRPAQYAALAGYVVAYAILFVPMLYVADAYYPGVIGSAAWVTILGFSALTAIVFFTGKDFTFMGGMLKWLGIVAILLIVASVLFGFELGTWFSVAMIAFAGAAILYDTSKVLNHYPEDRYVSAALELFGSVALMFWYVLRLFMSRD